MTESVPVRQITSEEFICSMVKHNAWDQLQEYIRRKEEKDYYHYCEYAESWRNELCELDNIRDINHFMKSFPLKDKKKQI